VTGNFGPAPKGGDTIGMLVDLTQNEKLKVYFFHNNRPLGLAFDISGVQDELFPVVSFNEEAGKVEIQKNNTPSQRTFVPEEFTGFNGKWSLKSFIDNQTDQEIDNITVSLVVVQISDESFALKFHVVNFLSTTITCTNGSWSTTPVIGTRIGTHGLGSMMESLLLNMLPAINRFEIENGNTLVLASAQKIAKFERTIQTAPQPSTENPFRL